MYSIKPDQSKNHQAFRTLNLILITLLVLNISLSICLFGLYQSTKPEISFLDVGQGDSILINSAKQQQILVDGGPDNTILGKLSSKLPPNDHHIEMIILTHPHEDHITGLFFVFENYNIDKLLIPKISESNILLENLIDLATQQKTEIIFAHFPQRIQFEQYHLKVLYPFDQNPPDIDDLNDNSLVLLLNNPNNQQKILLTGDISKNIEILLTKKYQQDIDVDILKIAHHGSDSSTSDTFLAMTSPDIAIISCGHNNRFNHPNPATIDTLNQANIQIFQTSINKDISFSL